MNSGQHLIMFWAFCIFKIKLSCTVIFHLSYIHSSIQQVCVEYPLCTMRTQRWIRYTSQPLWSPWSLVVCNWVFTGESHAFCFWFFRTILYFIAYDAVCTAQFSSSVLYSRHPLWLRRSFRTKSTKTHVSCFLLLKLQFRFIFIQCVTFFKSKEIGSTKTLVWVFP